MFTVLWVTPFGTAKVLLFFDMTKRKMKKKDGVLFFMAIFRVRGAPKKGKIVKMRPKK